MKHIQSAILLLVGVAIGSVIPSAFASSSPAEAANEPGATRMKSALCATEDESIWISASVMETPLGDRMLMISYINTFEKPNAWTSAMPVDAVGSETVIETKWGNLTITPSNGSWASFDLGLRDHKVIAKLD